MGIVCSCMASTFLLLGEIFSTVFLAVGEVGAILVRGLFSLIVGLCDVLAACACCCQVPFSERPDRNGYTYTTMALRSDNLADKSKLSSKTFAKVSKKKLFALPSGVKSKNKTQKDLVADTTDADETKVSTDSVEEKQASEAATPAAAPVQNGWFGGWFGGSATATA